MNEVVERLKAIVGKGNVFVGDEITEEYGHDEALNVKHCLPAVVVKPENSGEVAKILSLANEKKIPVTPRGGGTGVCGGRVAVSQEHSPMSRTNEQNLGNR